MSAYIKQLQRETAAYLAEEARYRESQASLPAGSSGGLPENIAHWHALLPDALRQRPYQMKELLKIFPTSAMAIGTALAQLGWVRRRHTSGAGPYIRFWVPPA